MPFSLILPPPALIANPITTSAPSDVTETPNAKEEEHAQCMDGARAQLAADKASFNSRTT